MFQRVLSLQVDFIKSFSSGFGHELGKSPIIESPVQEGKSHLLQAIDAFDSHIVIACLDVSFVDLQLM